MISVIFYSLMFAQNTWLYLLSLIKEVSFDSFMRATFVSSVLQMLIRCLTEASYCRFKVLGLKILRDAKLEENLSSCFDSYDENSSLTLLLNTVANKCWKIMMFHVRKQHETSYVLYYCNNNNLYRISILIHNKASL